MTLATEVAEFFLAHLLAVVGFLSAVLLLTRNDMPRRPTGSTIAWLLAIVLVPYVGVPLYLVFGGRKLRQRSAAKPRLGARSAPPPADPLVRLLCASGAAPPTEGNAVELLPDGEAAYAAILRALDGAERTIDVSTLIFACDEVGSAIADRLIARAKAGVTVRVLVDALFKFRSSRAQNARLVAAGVQLAWFMPLVHLPFRGSANLRLHRKEILVDGRLAIVGGTNLASEYIGPVPKPGRWRDLSMRVEGPAVADIATIFAADWAFAAHHASPEPIATEGPGAIAIQVVGSGPDAASDRIYDALLTAVFGAKRRLWIATPYFVPDDALARAIALAARRGVEVCILVPLRSNHLTADLAGAPSLRELAREGARIACYAPGMMHAKLVLVDDELAILGSANVDMRSLFLDYEIALFLHARSEVEAMAAWFEALLPDCVPLPAPGKARALVENVVRLLAPLE